MNYKFEGKILSINKVSKKLKVKIYDDDQIEHFNKHLENINKQQDKNNIYYFKYSNLTNFVIDKKFNYTHIEDLLLFNIRISGYFRKYCFTQSANDMDNLEAKEFIKGHTFIVKKIVNL